MAEEKNKEDKYVKRDTMLMVAFFALVVGFSGGLAVSYRSDSPAPTQGPTEQSAQMTPQEQVPQENRFGLSSEQFEKMVSGLEKEVSSNPQNVRAWNQLGICYASIKQYDEGIKAYKKALELDPNNANVWTNLGILFSRNGQGTEALEAFDKAVEIDPLDEKARFNKGVALMANFKDRKAGVQVWEEMLKINPSAKAPNGQLVKELIEDFKTRHRQQESP